MAHIQAHGRGVALYLTEIAPEIADELTQSGVSRERLAEIRSGEDAHAAGISSDLEIFVDGERVSLGSQELEGEGTPVVLALGRHYLLTEEFADGRWLDIETEEPFDATKLSADVATYILADGKSSTVSEVAYGGVSQRGETMVKDEAHTVIFPDGGIREVILSEDVAAEDELEEIIVIETRAPPPKRAPVRSARARQAPRKAPAKKTAAKKATARKATGKKTLAKKATAKKAPAKKTTSRKTTSKKATAKKATAKKRAIKPAPAKKATAKKATAKRASARKALANKPAPRRPTSKKAAAKKRRGSPKR